MYKYKNKAKRIYLNDQFYFVTIKTFHSKPIFNDPIKAIFFKEALMFLKSRGDFELAAGVLLPDHFHLLLMPIKKNISEIMHDLKSYTTSKVSERILLQRGVKVRRGVEASPLIGKINNQYKRQGFHALPSTSKRKTISIKVWQRSFYYHIIDNDNDNDYDFDNHYDYIIWNPEKHGYVTNFENWPWLWF